MGKGASKEEFTERLEKISTVDVTASDVDFWKPMFLTEIEPAQLFLVIKSEPIRQMRMNLPQNLAMLLFNCIEQLQHFLDEGAKAEKPLDFKSAGNSMKLITRIMPILFEELTIDPSAPPATTLGVDFLQQFFWNNSRMLDSDPDAQFTTLAGRKLTMTDADGNEKVKPLGLAMMEVLVGVACSRHGCVHMVGCKRGPAKKAASYPDVDPDQLWFGGVGPAAPEQVLSNNYLEANRITVVKCLLACCSGPLFQPAYLSADPFIDCLTQQVPQARQLVYSLLNAIIPYEPAGSLPYTSYIQSEQENLMLISIQLLLVVLDNGTLCRELQTARETDPKQLGRDVTKTGLQTPSRGVSLVARASKNVFWSVLASIDVKDDMAYIYDGLTKLLSNPIMAARTWLPQSQKKLTNTQELLALVWKILDCNVAFRRYIGRDADVGQFLVPLCWMMYQANLRRECVAQLQIALYVTFLLSGERTFCCALNAKMTTPHYLPLPAFTGTYVDLIVILFQQLAMSGHDWLRPFTDGFLTVIANISPYAKSIGSVAATKLVKLFEMCKSPKFIGAGEDNHICLGLIIQTFNNILQYQYEGNIPLVYAMLRNKDLFIELEADVQGTGAHPIPAEKTEKLDLNTILTVVRVLYPEMEEMYNKDNSTEEEAMIDFLAKTTMVGLLPLPHPILIRGFEATSYIYSYIEHWVWGLIYNSHHFPHLWCNGQSVKLFPVYRRVNGQLEQINQTQPAQAAPAQADADGAPEPAADDAMHRHHSPPPQLVEPEVEASPPAEGSLQDQIAEAELDVISMRRELDELEHSIRTRSERVAGIMKKIEDASRA